MLRRVESRTRIYWFTVVLVSWVWVGRFIDPSAAVERPLDTVVPLKWELVGIIPNLSSNSVGAIGLVVAVWSLARFVNVGRYAGNRKLALALTLLGVVTIIAVPQYRTGYIAFVVTLRRGLLASPPHAVFVLMAVGAILAVALWPSLVTNAQPYVLRGQSTQQLQNVSGRVDYWSAAVPVWRDSPIIGRGLWTASRYEVLAPLGLDTTARGPLDLGGGARRDRGRRPHAPRFVRALRVKSAACAWPAPGAARLYRPACAARSR